MNTAVKLAIASCIVISVSIYMAYLGLSSSWKYYLTVDECLSDAPGLLEQRIRVNGKIATGSLDIAVDKTRATFKLSGINRKLLVKCPGPLPDNLSEELDVVVEGRLTAAGWLEGEKVLTRCASKYASDIETTASFDPCIDSEKRFQ